MDLYEAESLAKQKMKEHRLDRWHFAFDNSKRRFGCCQYSRSRITLSRHLTLLNREDKVLDVILHEIAHALAGHGAGHGATWKATCRSIGAQPHRCYDSHDPDVVKPKLRYQATCRHCGTEFERAKRPPVGLICARSQCKRLPKHERRIIWTDTSTGRVMSEYQGTTSLTIHWNMNSPTMKRAMADAEARGRVARARAPRTSRRPNGLQEWNR
jgi:predicted SprT family Zn-dependent metalloprotease